MILVFTGSLVLDLLSTYSALFKLRPLISNKIVPFLTALIQCDRLPLPLPIREANDFLYTGTSVNNFIQRLPIFRKPLFNVLRQASICLKVIFPDSIL